MNEMLSDREAVLRGRWQEAETLIDTLTAEEARALRFVYEALPTGDVISCPPALLLAHVRHALRVRSLAPWGQAIPDAVFDTFVMIPRVNNEPIEAHRTVFFQALWPRIQGLSMTDAVLAVNLWCLEKATYQSTDGRTASPLTVVRRAFGRCGEESTLLASALRAVGIPARQCYVPRWAHCDDNHAWVEAWVDGRWHYLGACEPEPTLDAGWFTAAASRAMFVHTRGFGWQGGGESVVGRHGTAAILNRTAAYAAIHPLTICVQENGKPTAGVEIRFELANMGELYPVHACETNAEGRVTLELGMGCVHLHLRRGDRFMTHVVDARSTRTVVLDFDSATPRGCGPVSFALVPPVEHLRPETPVPPETLATHAAKVEECQQVRRAYEAVAPAPQGNGEAIDAFLLHRCYAMEDKQALLGTLSQKDWADVTTEVLLDALEGALPYKARWPHDVWQSAVLSPRVECEMLRPVRGFLRGYFAEHDLAPQTGPEVWAALCGQVSMLAEDASQEYVVADVQSTLRAGVADARAMDLLFVSACRALGIPARMNSTTGEKEWYDGTAFVPLQAKKEPVSTAKIRFASEQEKALSYGVHFTIGRLDEGVFQTLWLPEDVLYTAPEQVVAAGIYRLVTCARQVDGTVLVGTQLLDVPEAETVEVPVQLEQSDVAERLWMAPLDDPALGWLHGHSKGQDAAWLFIAPKEEPTEHLLVELAALHDRIVAQGIRLLFVVESPTATSPAMERLLTRLAEHAVLLRRESAQAQEILRRKLHTGDKRLPLAVAVRGDGKGLFAFANYNVGTGETVLEVLEAGRTR